MEPGPLIAGVKLIEQTVEPDQSLVGILGCEVHAVIVIPQRAQSFVDVTVGLVVGIKSGQHIGIVLIAETPRGVEVAWVAVTLRRIVSVVKMRANRRHAKARIVHLGDRRQGIDVARDLRRAIERLIGRPWAARSRAVVESPNGLLAQVGMLTGAELSLVELIYRLWHTRETVRINSPCLTSTGAYFSSATIGVQCRRRRQRRYLARHRRDGERHDEWPRRRACGLIAGYTVLIGAGTVIGP